MIFIRSEHMNNLIQEVILVSRWPLCRSRIAATGRVLRRQCLNMEIISELAFL